MSIREHLPVIYLTIFVLWNCLLCDAVYGFHIEQDEALKKAIFWKGEFGKNLGKQTNEDWKVCEDEDFEVCFEWNQQLQLRVNSRMIEDVNCSDVSWKALDCRQDIFEDCFDLTSANWYGGTVIKQMYWPIEKISERYLPYVTGDTLGTPSGYSGVQERYWLNSDGMALFVDWETPLWVSINSSNDQNLCLKAQYKNSPYNNYDNSPTELSYTVCQGKNVRHIHDYMSSTYISKPLDIPDTMLFQHPIWSTWAQYKEDITQSKVMEFAEAIVGNGFSNSQLEIDDRWESDYGDLDFDLSKFPDPKLMVEQLESMGFRVTLWVHPFVNLNTKSMNDGIFKFAFVSDPSNYMPALTSWWQGSRAMIIDFTTNRGTTWFTERLSQLQTKYNVSSFKFDAGESNWLPNCYSLSRSNTRNPSQYSTSYAEMAYSVDSGIRHQEVRIGSRSQHLPMFVRMMDKDSRWGSNNGIETLIPDALNFGVIGYPFILPDMIGGNAYVGGLPDKELFIRWTQVNAFLPSVQYSIVPWQYDQEVIDITRDMSDLHTKYSDKFISLAREAVITGAPIIRPLWWIAPTDPVALSIDSEFLVGDDLLVAPVLKQGARSRDIYLPEGEWFDELRHEVVSGSQWLFDYIVQLHELPYFTKV